jgi:Ca2+-binding EF-hand superfamily protein
MRNRKVALFCVVIFLVCAFSLFAEPVTRQQKFEHADRNDDGKVDRKEMKIEKGWEREQRSKVDKPWEIKADANKDGIVDAQEKHAFNIHTRAMVNTPIEKKYDVNSDGWLEPSEIREMLKDKHAIITTQGKAKVDSPIEEAYDTNKDGVIDSSEAIALKAAIQ